VSSPAQRPSLLTGSGRETAARKVVDLRVSSSSSSDSRLLLPPQSRAGGCVVAHSLNATTRVLFVVGGARSIPRVDARPGGGPPPTDNRRSSTSARGSSSASTSRSSSTSGAARSSRSSGGNSTCSRATRSTWHVVAVASSRLCVHVFGDLLIGTLVKTKSARVAHRRRRTRAPIV
jgi:hypothetical protein